jgi:hypothetical protein
VCYCRSSWAPGVRASQILKSSLRGLSLRPCFSSLAMDETAAVVCRSYWKRRIVLEWFSVSPMHRAPSRPPALCARGRHGRATVVWPWTAAMGVVRVWTGQPRTRPHRFSGFSEQRLLISLRSEFALTFPTIAREAANSQLNNVTNILSSPKQTHTLYRAEAWPQPATLSKS